MSSLPSYSEQTCWDHQASGPTVGFPTNLLGFPLELCLPPRQRPRQNHLTIREQGAGLDMVGLFIHPKSRALFWIGALSKAEVDLGTSCSSMATTVGLHLARWLSVSGYQTSCATEQTRRKTQTVQHEDV